MASSSRSLKLAHVNYLGDFARIMRLWIFLQTFSPTYCKHGMGTVALRLLKQSPSQVKSDRIPTPKSVNEVSLRENLPNFTRKK